MESDKATGGETESEKSTNIIAADTVTGNVYDRQDLNDYNFCQQFYTVTSITSLTKEIFRPSEFLDKDMKITHDSSSPQILIFHTKYLLFILVKLSPSQQPSSLHFLQ